MTRLVLLLSAAVLQAVMLPSNAQSSGEADPAQAKAPPVAATTPAQREVARERRFEAGAAASRSVPVCGDCGEPLLPFTVSRSEREAAAAERYARVSELNRAGLLPVTSLYYPDRPPGR